MFFCVQRRSLFLFISVKHFGLSCVGNELRKYICFAILYSAQIKSVPTYCKTTDSKRKSLCMQLRNKVECLDPPVVPTEPPVGLKCEGPTTSASTGIAESWQREVGCGSCDALPSNRKRSREWQAGVSSPTWVQQHEVKALHLDMEPWREEGRRKTRTEWCVCEFQMSFVHAWGPVSVWCILVSEVKRTSRCCKERNAHCCYPNSL